MRGRFKPWAEPFLREHDEIALTEINKEDSFFKNPNLYMEIGSGKGDFAVQMGTAHPEASILCLERDQSIAGIFCKKVVNEGLTNIRIVDADFDVLAPELNGFRFKRIFLNFSDPWPKKKHEKRRLTYAPRLSAIVSLLDDDGELVIKTDNDNLFEFTLEEAEKINLKIKEKQDPYMETVENDYMTEYERNFRSQGKDIHRVIFTR